MPAVAELVRAAIAAPTAENCQPWTFWWDGARLAVRHDADRARKGGGEAYTDSLLSLGCVLESLDVAGDRLGVVATPTLTVDDPRAVEWATVRFSPGTTGRWADARWTDAMARRCTDRRLYRGGSVREPVFTAIREAIAPLARCGVYVTGAPSPALLDFCARAEGLVWRHDSLYRDVLRWVRYTQREVEETGDGASWRAMGVDLPELPGLRLLARPGARAWLERAGAARAAGLHLRRQIASSAGLILITTRSEARTDVVEAGRAMMRAWLHLTDADYAAQPHSQASLLMYDALTSRLPAGILPEFHALYRAGRRTMLDAFGAPADELPVMLLRVGRQSSLPAHNRALRRPLDALYTRG